MIVSLFVPFAAWDRLQGPHVTILLPGIGSRALHDPGMDGWMDEFLFSD